MSRLIVIHVFLFFCKQFNADSVGSAQLDTLSAPGDREVTKGKKMGRRSNQKKSGQSIFNISTLLDWRKAICCCVPLYLWPLSVSLSVFYSLLSCIEISKVVIRIFDYREGHCDTDTIKDCRLATSWYQLVSQLAGPTHSDWIST